MTVHASASMVENGNCESPEAMPGRGKREGHRALSMNCCPPCLKVFLLFSLDLFCIAQKDSFPLPFRSFLGSFLEFSSLLSFLFPLKEIFLSKTSGGEKIGRAPKKRRTRIKFLFF